MGKARPREGDYRGSAHDRTDFMDSGACLDSDPELFFPDSGEGTVQGEREWSRAKRVCEECSVRSECLEYAIDNQHDFGVWGGMSEEERKALVRQRKRLEKACRSDPYIREVAS